MSRLSAPVIFLAALSGCASLTPHENFVAIHSAAVGKSISAPPRVIKAYSEDLVASRSLPNGNIENEYRSRGTCRYFYAFDPNTKIILRWRFEGSESDCEIVP